MSLVKMQHITSNMISLHDKNLDRAVEIGITFMHIFEANWPEGFLDPITKQIVTCTWVGKPLKLGTETVYDPAVIYGRVLGLQSRPRSININDISVHELAPFATAMFDTPFEIVRGLNHIIVQIVPQAPNLDHL